MLGEIKPRTFLWVFSIWHDPNTCLSSQFSQVQSFQPFLSFRLSSLEDTSIWVWSNAVIDPIQGTSCNVRRANFFLLLCFIAITSFSCSGGGECELMVVHRSIIFLRATQVPNPQHPHISTVLIFIPLIHCCHSYLECRIELQRDRID